MKQINKNIENIFNDTNNRYIFKNINIPSKIEIIKTEKYRQQNYFIYQKVYAH